MAKIEHITGTITLSDGSTSKFLLGAGGMWQQWGATRERLSATVEAVEAMRDGLVAAGIEIDTDADEGEGDDNLQSERECANCGDYALTLSSREWCDGCEEEADRAPRYIEYRAPRCIECGGAVTLGPPDFGGEGGMCGTCWHDAARSGFDGEESEGEE